LKGENRHVDHGPRSGAKGEGWERAWKWVKRGSCWAKVSGGVRGGEREGEEGGEGQEDPKIRAQRVHDWKSNPGLINSGRNGDGKKKEVGGKQAAGAWGSFLNSECRNGEWVGALGG